MGSAAKSPYELASEAAARLGIALAASELATLASDHDMGDAEVGALAVTFDYLAEKRRQASIETLLRLSRLPRREPKTFDGFDFSRIQGRDASALAKLPALADLYAHRNVAFIGPGGIGKTHLAQAYGRECCMRGLKTYYVKASELRDRFQRAAERGSASRVVATLVKPTCLIVDEVGRCTFDRACTDLFFDVIDRRYEKEGPNTMLLTSNVAPSAWDEFFTVQERMPEGSSILNPYTVRSDVLSILLSRDFDRFVDWSKAECDFENDDFRQLLRFAALFPADVNQEAADTAMDAGDRFREQKQMLAQSFLYSPDALLWNSSYLEGIPCTYVGWPVSEGVGSILRPDTGFAMSSTCRDKDAAWEFLRGLLTEAGQKEVSSLPTNRSVFEARLQELMTTEYVTDAAGNQMLDEAGKPLQQSRVSWYDEEGVQHNVYSMSAEQAE